MTTSRVATAMVAAALLVLAGGCASPQREAEPAAPQRFGESEFALSWLAGSWISQKGDQVSEEHWTQPRGTPPTMLGMNRTMAGGRMVFFEYLRMDQTPEGIFYLASPRGRMPPSSFKLVEHDAGRRVVFENPEHDFPSRIIYELRGDELHARIEGTRNGQPASAEWKWQRGR